MLQCRKTILLTNQSQSVQKGEQLLLSSYFTDVKGLANVTSPMIYNSYWTL